MNDSREHDEHISARIYDALEYGENRAKSADELSVQLDIDKRQVHEEVRKERLAGIPICSSSKGYFRGSREDQIATFNLLYNRLKGSAEVIAAMKKTIWGDGEPDNQMKLSDLFDMTA